MLNFVRRLKSGLKRTRDTLTDGLATLFLGRKQIDDALFDDIESQLLAADVGVTATRKILDNLITRSTRKELADPAAVYLALQQALSDILQPVVQPLVCTEQHPFVIVVVGVNGSGKTTTIGKLAKHLQLQGKSVLLAAGDTFRAAAIEQLQIWGSRNDIPVIAQHTGADSASVIFDAITSAKARNIDVVIADTAGRLHTQSTLMDELQKVVRVIKKLDDQAPHEVMLVLDAGIGQNALVQARQFNAAVNLSSITVTKLDGTAKGGIIFAIAESLQIPIRFIGIGEGVDDLRPFNADDFITALFTKET